jgi:hypothetical protein
MRTIIALLACTSLFGADLTNYPKARPANFQYGLYRQILPQPIPTSLSAVITQFTGCASAQGGVAPTTLGNCGVFVDFIVVSCAAGAAGTVVVQDQQSTPRAIVPTVTIAASTVYLFNLTWAWAPGGVSVQQAGGTGCTFYMSWGQA